MIVQQLLANPVDRDGLAVPQRRRATFDDDIGCALHGHEVRLVQERPLHVGRPIPHVHYPPLFPALLVPLVASGASIYAIKIVVAGLGLLGLNANFVLFSRTLGARLAWLVTAGVLVCPVFLDPALSVMSDGPGFLLATLALLAADRALTDPAARRWIAVAAGLWIGLAFLARTAAVVLLPAMILSALFLRSVVPRRERMARTLVALALAGAIAAPWVNHVRAPAARAGVYMAELGKGPAGPSAGSKSAAGSVLQRPWPNFNDLWRRMSVLEAPRAVAERHPRLATLLPFALVGLVALAIPLATIGGLRALLIGRRIGDVYAVGSIAAVLLWVTGGPRLLIPALPFLIAWTATGAGALAGWLARHRAGTEAVAAAQSAAAQVAALLAIALGLGVTFGTAQMRDRLAGSPGGWWPALQRSLERVAAEAGPDARVLTRPATAPFYFHGLRSAKPLAHLTGDPKADLALIERTQADYVILTPRLLYYTEDRVLGVIEAFPERFRELETGRLARAYRILPPPPASQGSQVRQ
jgi:hypothetical protein